MIVENTEGMRGLKKAVASMAIENMYVSKEFLEELVKVERGEKTSEQLRQRGNDYKERSEEGVEHAYECSILV